MTPTYRITQLHLRHLLAGVVVLAIMWATSPPVPDAPSYDERVAAKLLRLQMRGDSIRAAKRGCSVP